ncbi:MAG: SpoIIIAC/SpoIIIAD family protein [Lachnospiraceae bacterium]|nr:SpoIIIAC/SpoIIIAD family protein [Lachnospiraceae bacterium]
MSFFGLAVMTVIAALMAVYFKSIKSEYGLFISLVVCIVAMFFGISKLSYFMEAIEIIRQYIGLDNEYITIILKIIGISYVAEFTSDVCKDCGYGAMSNQIQTVGKLTVLGISMPIVLALLETIGKCFEMGEI